jgi:starch-binding outer membrane protein, SusD/RagB family
LLGDEVGAEAANQLINQISLPDKVSYDDGTSTLNSAPSKQVFRINNSVFNPGNNPFYFEWLSMYALNNAANKTLSVTKNITDLLTRRLAPCTMQDLLLILLML